MFKLMFEGIKESLKDPFFYLTFITIFIVFIGLVKFIPEDTPFLFFVKHVVFMSTGFFGDEICKFVYNRYKKLYKYLKSYYNIK